MNSKQPKTPLALAAAVLAILAWTHVEAQDGDDPDWPCEQALVPEISAAVVWDGPSVEGLSDRWQQDPEIAALVHRLTARGTDTADAEALIDAFAKARPAAERDASLTLLFAGVLQVLNADRRKLDDGILRYSRDQQRRAEELDRDLSEIVRLEEERSESVSQRLTELKRRVELEQRVFDDRERSVPYLCTRPRVVEQRIGDLARAIAYQLE